MSKARQASLFACDLDELKSATGTVERQVEHDDGSFSCVFRFTTELKIPIIPGDEFRVRRTPEAMRIDVNAEGIWIAVGHVAMENWPVPNTTHTVVTCILPDPARPKMLARWK